MPDPDIAELRAQARKRALSRPPTAFDGTIDDLHLSALALRRYVPRVTSGAAIVFLHGGYGIFGDLELQDGRCRRMAESMQATVLSVDYRLAPEASLDDAVDDALRAVGALTGSHRPLLVSGDSAGAAVAVWAAARQQAPIDGLLLTSPNIDLSLAHVDRRQPESPDLTLSSWAFARWGRGDQAQAGSSLPIPSADFPATLMAVGSRDGLCGDAAAFARSCSAAGVRNRVITVDGEGHGLSAGALEHVWIQARGFFAPLGPA